MSLDPSDPAEQGGFSPDDTAAFQRFYFGDEPDVAARSWWYRVFVGWWRRS